MKMVTYGMRLDGTVAEFRRLADALALIDPEKAHAIRHDTYEDDGEGYLQMTDDNSLIDRPGTNTMSFGFSHADTISNVVRAIRALQIQLDEEGAEER